MKVGILTFHNALNQGAVLQAYALQTYIEKKGHEVEFIDYRPEYRYSLKKDFLAKSLNVMLFKWRNVYNGIKFTRRNDFPKVLHIGPVRYRSFQELKSNPPQYDLYICGSDQVWHFPQCLNPVYLMDFLPDGAKMISYAASMGQHFPPQNAAGDLRKSLCRFEGLSLREDAGAEYVRHLFRGERDVSQDIDPTLLISSAAYDNIAEQVTTPKRYIATYILSIMEPGHYDVIDAARRTLNAEVLNLRNPSTCSIVKGATNKIVTPYQWLSYIKNSVAVIAGSFHAVVFALIYHKPFVLIQPASLRAAGGNRRVVSLLKPLGLSHHCVYDATDVEGLLKETIDWEYVDRVISQLAEQSKTYLNRYL